MPLNITQVKETCIYIKDIARSRQFYHDKLGLEIISISEGRHIFFHAGSSVFLCFIAEATKEERKLPPHYGSGNLHFAFEVRLEDYADWKAHLQKEGIPIEHEAKWRAGKSLYFRDPDDHLVELVVEGMWD